MDARIQKTKNKLREALLELLEHKNLQEITVSELCASSRVNRSTFYVHYNNIAEVFEEISDEIVAEMRSDLFRENLRTPEAYLRVYFRKARENQTVFRTIHSVTIHDPMIRKMVELNNELLGSELFVPLKNENLKLTYIFSGFYGMVEAWLAGGCQESDDELIETMRDFFKVSF